MNNNKLLQRNINVLKTTERFLALLSAIFLVVISFPYILMNLSIVNLTRLRSGKPVLTNFVEWTMTKEEDNNQGVSATALSSAIFRYMGYMEGLNNDFLVGDLLPISTRIICRVLINLYQLGYFLIDVSSHGYYGYCICETQFFDEVALSQNFDNIVVLGSGFDTRLFRLPFKRGMKTYELDTSDMLQLKKKIVTKTFGRFVTVQEVFPSFVEVDFSKQSIMSQLIKDGFDPLQKSLFILESVSFYLSYESLKDLFMQISTNCKSGTLIALDLMEDTWSDAENRTRGKKLFGADSMKHCVKAGEPFQFGLGAYQTPQQIFEPWGFRVIQHLKPKEYESKFLQFTQHKSSEKCHLCVLEVI